jgi:hypothetical protein
MGTGIITQGYSVMISPVHLGDFKGNMTLSRTNFKLGFRFAADLFVLIHSGLMG